MRRISRRSAEELCEIKVVLARHLNRLIFASITPAQLAALRTLVGKRVKMKFVPDLRFVYDEFVEEMVYARPAE